jgi:hypothetical protein
MAARRIVNLRHATALAIVGWYLMVPTPAPETFMTVTPPIGRWAHRGSYDSEKECDQALDEMYRKSERAGFEMKGFSPEDVRRSWAFAQCISTDDPRLKETK